MNRWIAALAMGLATAANAPAAAPSPATHNVISSAEAARPDGAHLQPAGLVLDHTRASITSDTGGNALAANGPDPVIAWILAAGFLGIIVVRRTHTSQGY